MSERNAGASWPGAEPERRGLWSRRSVRIGAGIAVVACIGGGAYGVATAVAGSSTPAATHQSTTSTSTPRSRFPGRAGFAKAAATGVVSTVGSSSFTLRESSGSTVTVDVSSSTTYTERGTGSGTGSSTGSASFSDVKSGVTVAVSGSTSGSTVKATSVAIVPSGTGGFGGGFGNLTFGSVASVGSSSFTVTSRTGSTVTVDVSSSTTYTERGTGSGTGSSTGSASFSDVKSGVTVAVSGSTSGSTVKATSVTILPNGFGFGFGGGFGGGGGGGGFGGAGSSSAGPA